MQTITKSPEETKDSILNNTEWLSSWYQKECNGDWEHTYGISIQTLDNPGWSVQIDLHDTSLENLEILPDAKQISDSDWYVIKIKDKKFIAVGDSTKLDFLIGKFRELVVQS
ncbi:MAG: immunity 53 family protein [Leptospiraceae bacterium]|nr:immunity 53 family protein [Leptospiraceae bacterium]MBK8394905.1 immunity 53 family protein [Leptospiraceae bacterium]